MKRITSIVGARPQFVKAAVVSAQMQRAGIQEVMIHTGQHYDANMSAVFFDDLGIPKPKYNLGIGGGTHGEMTGGQLIEIERCLIEEKPAAVLVYGDTNSTLAGALAAIKLHIPVVHVEAGLRSFNQAMPEEVNRILTDRISAVLFTPSRVATDNLRAEGVADERIFEVGDVMYDVALKFGGAETGTTGSRRDADGRPVFLVTIHRAENTDHPERMRAIIDALIRLARDASVVFPAHPRTRQVLTRTGFWKQLSSCVQVIEPLGYREMLAMVRDAQVVITDSGGLQKEAYFMGTPCVTLRDQTEWIETVAMGWNRLVTELLEDNIVKAVLAATVPAQSFEQPYGDGHAADRIAEQLLGML